MEQLHYNITCTLILMQYCTITWLLSYVRQRILFLFFLFVRKINTGCNYCVCYTYKYTCFIQWVVKTVKIILGIMMTEIESYHLSSHLLIRDRLTIKRQELNRFYVITLFWKHRLFVSQSLPKLPLFSYVFFIYWIRIILYFAQKNEWK